MRASCVDSQNIGRLRDTKIKTTPSITHTHPGLERCGCAQIRHLRLRWDTRGRIDGESWVLGRLGILGFRVKARVAMMIVRCLETCGDVGVDA